MGFYIDAVLPRLTHWCMSSAPIGELRKEVLAPVQGTVLEIGFGSGLSLPFYGPGVIRLLTVEPSAVARKLARKAVARASFPVEDVGLEGEQLGIPSASVDWVVTNFTLCTIPHPEAALHEVVRVLKPGGGYAFAEHGLSPSPAVARWQQRLNGFQQWVAGGCHLTRPIDDLVRQSTLRIETMSNRYIPGPKTHAYLYLGAARKP